VVGNYFAANAANAIEYILDLTLSPREVRTQGTFAPITIAPSSPLANFVQVFTANTLNKSSMMKK